MKLIAAISLCLCLSACSSNPTPTAAAAPPTRYGWKQVLKQTVALAPSGTRYWELPNSGGSFGKIKVEVDAAMPVSFGVMKRGNPATINFDQLECAQTNVLSAEQ